MQVPAHINCSWQFVFETTLNGTIQPKKALQALAVTALAEPAAAINRGGEIALTRQRRQRLKARRDFARNHMNITGNSRRCAIRTRRRRDSPLKRRSLQSIAIETLLSGRDLKLLLVN